MAIKVYLSQANQAGNTGPGGYTEKAACAAIVAKTARILRADGRFAVKTAPSGPEDVGTAVANCEEANAWGAEYYVAVHSNAGGTGARGTITFYHSSSVVGKGLARALQEAVAPLSPGGDHGIATHDGFIELNRPHAAAALIELEAHDYAVGVAFLTEQQPAIAQALYRGICKGAGLEARDPSLTVRMKTSLWVRYLAWRAGA